MGDSNVDAAEFARERRCDRHCERDRGNSYKIALLKDLLKVL